jgi:GINS complex subunit 2
MAMNLKLKKKCHIVPPDWLTVGAPELQLHFGQLPTHTAPHRTDFLQDRLTQETSRAEFSQFPFHFTEISKLLLDV